MKRLFIAVVVVLMMGCCMPRSMDEAVKFAYARGMCRCDPARPFVQPANRTHPDSEPRRVPE